MLKNLLQPFPVPSKKSVMINPKDKTNFLPLIDPKEANPDSDSVPREPINVTRRFTADQIDNKDLLTSHADSWKNK